jgi:hypothetical protein
VLGEAAFHYSTTPLLQHSKMHALALHRAWLQGNRLKTRNADWNGFAWTNWRHFLFVLRIAAMTWRRCAFVIEIFADSIRIEHLGRNELPADVPKAVTESELVIGIDPQTVSEGQRPAGFLHDRPLASAGNQERSDAEKKKGLEAHERLGCFEISAFRRRLNCSISANLESISKTSPIP